MTLNQIAEEYVKLVLSIGLHDDSYVDAYYGPAEWKSQTTKKTLSDLLSVANLLIAEFKALPTPPKNFDVIAHFLAVLEVL